MSEPMTDEAIVVYITAPNEEEAANIAQALVRSRIAACVNIVEDIRSIYSWQGKVEDDSEVLMIVKTRRALFDKLSNTVMDLHSFDVPEVIAIPIIDGSADYLAWLRESTS